MECAVHMTTAAEEKRLAAMIAKAVAEALATVSKAPRRRVRRADDDIDLSSDHKYKLEQCGLHMKAMGDCLDDAMDHHEKAMDCLEGVVKGLDTDIEDETGSDSSQSDEKAAAERVQRLLARARATAKA
jgi:hypothetical protein